MSIDYGFASTDDVKYDSQGLPVGTYKVMIMSEEPWKESGFVVEYEILTGEKKGTVRKYWYLTKHENATTSNIAKQNIKRIADATGKPVSATSPLKGRVFTITVAPQKNDPDRTEIKKYSPENVVITEEPPQ